MSYKNSGNPNLSALAVLDPAKAKAKLRVALQNAKGSLVEASAALGISTRTLRRYLAKFPELNQEYKRQRIKALS